ncbi:RNA polymerase sigma factor [Pseudorhodoferax sp.]|uniref:RNA polymerase sigma factor n=1 Tax=Pseudorhodoferax sp. TaxID=1993553 RepID=UPI002DD63111|nr:RNA polymerase sigma factor [Pseudorhodoferax sp.]
MSWLTRLGFVADAQGRRADEAALLARVLRGDAQALALLYRRESGPVYRYALALVADEAAALDAMQEAFTQLLLNPQGFEPGRGTLGAYLAGIARHQLLARWRDAKRFVALIDDVDDEAADDEKPGVDAAGAGLSAEQRLVDAQRSEQLWSAVRRLAWSQREALVLVDLQERSYEEAAAVAGTRVDVLRSRLHRARARLAELLAAPQGEPKP